MSSHSDAIGYLLELRDDLNAPWFSYLCDLAVVASGPELSPHSLDHLLHLFKSAEPYVPRGAAAVHHETHDARVPSPREQVRLQSLSGFSNFRRLAPTVLLEVDTTKRLTLVFGTNGSGKSSICDAIRVLAQPGATVDSLSNARAKSSEQPRFDYCLAGEAQPTTWDATQGYGGLSGHVKVFDSGLATRSVTDHTRPGDVIEVAAFRLEVFEYCGSFVGALRDAVRREIADANDRANAMLARLAGACADIPEGAKQPVSLAVKGDFAPLQAMSESLRVLTAEETEAHREDAAEAQRMAEAVTDEGVARLARERDALRTTGELVSTFLAQVRKANPEGYIAVTRALDAKRTLVEGLALRVLPDGVDSEAFTRFLVAADEVGAYESEQGSPCPFCRRPMDSAVLELVQTYHAYLADSLRRELAELQEEHASTEESLRNVARWEADSARLCPDLLGDVACEAAAEAMRQQVERMSRALGGVAVAEDTPSAGLEALVQFQNRAGQESAKREEAIRLARDDRAKHDERLREIQARLDEFSFHQLMLDNGQVLHDVVQLVERNADLESRTAQAGFSQLLRRLTDTGKAASERLVVSEFQRRLDDEYAALSGRRLKDHGVTLRVVGGDQSVAVAPEVGRTPVHRVLSEGERKVHALALFFCELTSRPCDIVVFDDPTTSFDYNGVAAFAKRLRSLIQQEPGPQIVVFTHNWDLFVEMQRVISRSRLTRHLDVQILEHCASIRSYCGNREQLKRRVESELSVEGQPPSERVELVCSLMRRLIEAMVNELVFAKERHQYTATTLRVSMWREFTRLVPLRSDEADCLSDLYADLSPMEHDDPRTMYTCVTREQLQNWYDRIRQVEGQLAARAQQRAEEAEVVTPAST